MARTSTQGGKTCGGWHNGGCVWDKVATEWPGDGDLACKRVRCQTLEDKKEQICHFCVAECQTLDNAQDKNWETTEVKIPRLLGPADVSNRTREEGATVQLCGDSDVAGKWISGFCALGQKYRQKIVFIQKTLHSWWKRKVAIPISHSDDYVKHIFREHNQEADHWANLCAEGQRKIVVDKGNNNENLVGGARLLGGCGHVDHSQQKRGTVWHMYGHDSRSGDGHPGPCLEQKPQYDKHQSMH